MRDITKLPKFKAGGVCDLSYRNGGLPNRILINTIFIREQDTEWQYQVLMENNGETTTMSESFISDRLCHRNGSKVYQMPDVLNRYLDGWRWCGNFNNDEATNKANLIAENENVKNVRLYPALSPACNLLAGKKGIWIRWRHTINEDGSCTGCNIKDYTQIK